VHEREEVIRRTDMENEEIWGFGLEGEELEPRAKGGNGLGKSTPGASSPRTWHGQFYDTVHNLARTPHKPDAVCDLLSMIIRLPL